MHELFISFYGTAPPDLGGSEEKARAEFARAVELSKGMRAGPYVALADPVSVKTAGCDRVPGPARQGARHRRERRPSLRLTNVISQQKAQWLLDHVDRYFLEGQDSR